MAETPLARSPLGTAGGAALRMHGDAAAVELREFAAPAMCDLRLAAVDAGALSAAETALACKLPLTPNKSVAAGARVALWLGPDQWLILLPAADAGALARGLAGHAASVVDVSDLRAVFELAGPGARDVLRKGCAIDLHPRVFGPGDCALTALARVRVALCQVDDRPAYRILIERSYAVYLWDWLIDAMAEFGGG
jgi:sarcosine oxidase subunit gamma